LLALKNFISINIINKSVFAEKLIINEFYSLKILKRSISILFDFLINPLVSDFTGKLKTQIFVKNYVTNQLIYYKII